MDIHGSLSALSISDQTAQFHTANDANTSVSDSDQMDVDTESFLNADDEDTNAISKSDTSSIRTLKESGDAIETSTPVKSVDVDVEPENSSFVSALSSTLFSPTNIGAKYAMKLLPAPPTSPSPGDKFPNSTIDQIDGEYDTSMVKTLTKRHINSFSSNSDNSLFLNDKEPVPEFVYNPSKRDYEEAQESFNNSMSQSYLYRRYNRASPSPVKEFSRDYSADVSRDYSNNFSNNITKDFNDRDISRFSNMSNSGIHTPTSVQVHHHHYYYSPNKSHENYDDTSYLSVNSIASGIINNSLSLESQVKLPPPWKQESIPKLKYAYVISTYLQLTLNFAVSFYGIYLLYNIVRTIRRDIEIKLLEQSTNLLVEIESCRRQYYDNNCSPDLIVPALEKPCNYWLKCMNQPSSPNLLGNKSSVSAETLGLVINSLIEPLGLKFFILVFGFLVTIFLCNFMFGFIRAKTYYGKEIVRSE